MNTDVRYMMDIERFVKWVYEHSELFPQTENAFDQMVASNEQAKKYKRFQSYPVKQAKGKSSNNTVDYINMLIRKENEEKHRDEEVFELINIADLLLAINNSRDHHRGKQLSGQLAVTSTEKKIMNIILLGKLFEDSDNEYFSVSAKDAETDPEAKKLYDYLSAINPGKKGQPVSKFYYIPGRAFSYSQICSASEHYRNSITSQGIWDGLIMLSETGFICRIGNTNLFKPDISFCREFLMASTK